jgi:ATP-dependent protease ClpP protease subunit
VNVEIARGVGRVHLGLSSFGGALGAGVAAYTLLRGMPCELITHNTGNVGSAANVLFLAGRTRYAAPFATFYFHGTSTGAPPDANAELLQSYAQGLEIDNNRTAELLAANTDIGPAEAARLLRSVGETWRPERARDVGLIHDIRDWNVPAGASFYQLILAGGS